MIKKILIYRPDNIGDVILFSGALKHIRNIYSDAHITLAVQEHIINLVELCPFVNEVVSIDIFAFWLKLQKMGIRGAYRFSPQIRYAEKLIKRFIPTTNFDLVIYPVKSPTNTDLEILANIRCKKLIGIVGCIVNLPRQVYLKPENIYSDCLDVTCKNPWRHELYTTLDFLKYLGADLDDIKQIQPVVWLSDSDKSLLNDFDFKKPIIGLFPSAASDIRIWKLENYGLLAKIIPDTASFIIFGGPQDVEIANKVRDELCAVHPDASVLNLAGKTTLRQLYVAISVCSILISMDSSALHMGIASGTPTIGIAGGGHFGRFVPWGDTEKNVILTNKLSCFHCNWHCTRGNIECIDGVSVDEVAATLKKLLPSL
jgi:ADP-heptose:LPS heptosyltransferase